MSIPLRVQSRQPEKECSVEEICIKKSVYSSIKEWQWHAPAKYPSVQIYLFHLSICSYPDIFENTTTNMCEDGWHVLEWHSAVHINSCPSLRTRIPTSPSIQKQLWIASSTHLQGTLLSTSTSSTLPCAHNRTANFPSDMDGLSNKDARTVKKTCWTQGIWKGIQHAKDCMHSLSCPTQRTIERQIYCTQTRTHVFMHQHTRQHNNLFRTHILWQRACLTTICMFLLCERSRWDHCKYTVASPYTHDQLEAFVM